MAVARITSDMVASYALVYLLKLAPRESELGYLACTAQHCPMPPMTHGSLSTALLRAAERVRNPSEPGHIINKSADRRPCLLFR